MRIAREALSEIEGDPPYLSAEDLSYLSEALLVAATEPTLVAVALAAGCSVTVVPGLPLPGILLDNGAILVRSSPRSRVLNLEIAHEVAHHVLRGQHHTHGDVWVLALLLAGELSAPVRAAA